MANLPSEQPDSSDDASFDSSADLSPHDQRLIDRLDRLWQSERASAAPPVSGDMQIGPYVVNRTVGHGAFGVVFHATDTRLRRDVALKVPRPEVLVCFDKLQRFEDEAQVAAKLDHPGIVPIYEADLAGPTPYIASAFCAGPDLADWLESHPSDSRDCQSVARLMLDVVRAVAYAHRQGVVHRDIKPSNILLTNKDETSRGDSLDDFSPRLTDFGLAKLTDVPLTNSRSSWILGTPTYMAPEQLLPQWGAVGEKADVFALGSLLWELLSGAPPRQGETYSDIISGLLSEQPIDSDLKRTDVPSDLRVIVARSLAKDPIERYESAAALADDLAAYLAGERISARQFSWLDSFARWASQPQRPSQISFFMIPVNLLTTIWMVSSMLIIWGEHFPGDDRWTVFIQVGMIALGYNLTVVGLCWLRLSGHKWCTPLALIFTLGVTVLVPLLVLTGTIRTFSDLYRDYPFFDTINHTQILFFGLGQAFLLGVSAYADLQQRRR
ncbi:serine/threonine protein kinase [Blastopirellula sp. JC732]|uniref:Serine/threonine protein kinase n=1 Tax=Blastopirellula sediminis TaxID=2894196 RepID=A0A9X1SHT9_9BACT|nr:serine/threonine-protein kinase [Blastopirellula sediminis]MCC9605878.1 serine/threonine protein kinase [Blastopirellula sediminis]MCC9630823.1 serine/threonine protein kinase [Blastopirellula sediminis]